MGSVTLLALGGGIFTKFFHPVPHVSGRLEEIKQATPPSLPTFYPTESQGKQIIVNKNHLVDEELQAVWQNLKNIEDRGIDGVSISKNEKPLYSFKAMGNTTSLSDVNWRIHAKRNALTKVALALINLCKSEDQAKNSFLNGELKTLTFNDTKKSATITFTAKCSL